MPYTSFFCPYTLWLTITKTDHFANSHEEQICIHTDQEIEEEEYMRCKRIHLLMDVQRVSTLYN